MIFIYAAYFVTIIAKPKNEDGRTQRWKQIYALDDGVEPLKV